VYVKFVVVFRLYPCKTINRYQDKIMAYCDGLKSGSFIFFATLKGYNGRDWEATRQPKRNEQCIKSCYTYCVRVVFPMRVWGRRGRGRMVVGFTTTYAISAYHQWCCEFESRRFFFFIVMCNSIYENASLYCDS